MAARQELLDAGERLYKESLANKGMTPIKVPELEMTFYCPPALDLRERTRMAHLLKEEDPKSGAQMIVYCARDDDNKKIFNDIDVDHIAKKWDPMLVDKLALKFMALVMPEHESTVDDALKNSKATPSSTSGSGSPITNKSQ